MLARLDTVHPLHFTGRVYWSVRRRAYLWSASHRSSGQHRSDASQLHLDDRRNAARHHNAGDNHRLGSGSFDNFPDRNKVFRDGTQVYTAQSNNGIFTYPSQSPFGMNGRFVYTRVTYTF